MPTYEYFCTKCEQSFDTVQSMKDPHLETCPENCCRMETWGHGCVKRQLGTGAGLIFKGTGFYITDYRSDSYKEAAKKDSSAAAGTSTAETSKPKADSPAPATTKSEPAKASTPPPKPATP